MVEEPGKFESTVDICGASETEWVTAVHGSATSAQLYEQKDTLIQQSCHYQRFFACLEFVKYNFGYTENENFAGFEYQRWQTETLRETNQEVYLRENELREFMVEPKCSDIKVKTNNYGEDAREYQNRFELKGSYKINGQEVPFSCEEDVRAVRNTAYQVRACGCVPSGAQIELDCHAVKKGGTIKDVWEVSDGYRHIGYHIEINGEKLCQGVNALKQNGSTQPGRQNTDGTDYDNPDVLKHAHHTMQIRSVHEAMYMKHWSKYSLTPTPVEPWCWRKWEDLDYGDFRLDMTPDKCGASEAEDCEPRDDDICLQQSDAWGVRYTCATSTQWCTSWAKDMQRCCPESCGTGSLSEEECNALGWYGNCAYPNDAQPCGAASAATSEDCIDVFVGSSPYHSKTVNVDPTYSCPSNVDKTNWYVGANGENVYGDTFSTSQTGSQVTVTRTDYPSGWGMSLQFQCCASESSGSCLYTHTPNAAISGYNNVHLSGVTVDQCKEACCENSSCKSFDYYKTHNLCDLSYHSAADVGGLKTNYDGNPFDHYELKTRG